MLRYISPIFFPYKYSLWLPAMSNFELPEADVSSLHMTALKSMFSSISLSGPFLNSNKTSVTAAFCSKKLYRITTHGIWSHFCSLVTPVSFICPLLLIPKMSEHGDSLFTLPTVFVILQTCIKSPSFKSSCLFSCEQSDKSCSPLHSNSKGRKEGKCK